MKIAQFINNVTHTGVSNANSDAESKQIIITNYLSIIICIICIIGTTLSYLDRYTTAFWTYFTFFFIQFIIFWLQKKGFTLATRILLSTLPQLFLVVPIYITQNLSQLYVDHFHVLLATGLIPALVFFNKKDSLWLNLGIAYSLLFIIAYDTILGFNSSPNLKFEHFDATFLKFKVRQLMLYFIIAGGYLVKIKLSQHFEIKLSESNIDLSEKNKKINNIVGAIQIQNEELQAQKEEMRSQNDDLQLKQQEIIDINGRIETHIQTLMSLTKSRNLKKGDLANALAEICKVTANTLKIQRVSIWEYDWRSKSIVCKNLYETIADSHSFGVELLERDFAPYFDAITNENIVAASNAYLHPVTSCFAENYLKANNVCSVLDAPYFINTEFSGIICCETVGNYKSWTGDEIVFVKSVADLISVSYEATERKKAEDRIRVQKEEIVSKNEALLLQQERIKLINEQLEQKVHERTNLLERKNTQLQEYTYVNSHLLRGPLCRILGIIYLLEHNMVEDSNIDFLIHLKESASELDEMVKKITRNLEIEHPQSMEEILGANKINAN
ncbi:MAG: GAF domain-containing protein [Cytophagales bacterium]